MRIKTNILKKLIVFVVGLCLTASAFHVHQLHPDYSLDNYSLDHHLTNPQPDCIACRHLLQSKEVDPNKVTAYFEVTAKITPDNYSLSSREHTDLNNKSPPTAVPNSSNTAFIN